MRITLLLWLVATLTASGSMQFDSGSSRYAVETGWTAATNTPLTIFVRFYPFSASVGTMVAINASTGSARFALEVDNSNRVIARAADPDGTFSSAFGGAYSVNTWHSAAAVFSTDTVRYVYLDGIRVGTNSATRSVSGLNRVLLGSRILSGAVGSYYNGLLMDVAIWNVALSTNDVYSLHTSRVSPRRIKPHALVGYWPLLRGGQNLITGKVLSLTNSPSINIANPPVTGGR